MRAQAVASGALLVGIVGLLSVPTASAAEGIAYVTPATANAGDALILVYTVRATSAAEARVLDDVRCVITGPDGAAAECDPFAELVDVRLQGGERSYVFDIIAPDLAGNYTVSLTRTALAGVSVPPSGSDAAEATFEVARAPSEEIDLGGASPPDVTVPESVDDPASRNDGGRWLATMFMATGAATTSIALARRGSGGA